MEVVLMCIVSLKLCDLFLHRLVSVVTCSACSTRKIFLFMYKLKENEKAGRPVTPMFLSRSFTHRDGLAARSGLVKSWKATRTGSAPHKGS